MCSASRPTTPSVTIAPPAIDKTILATNQAHTTGNNVAIGEIVTYQVVVTVPEAPAAAPNWSIRSIRAWPLWMCFSVTASPDLSTSIGTFAAACNDPTNPTVTGSGEPDSSPIDLGTVTNSNIDDTAPETITISTRPW